MSRTLIVGQLALSLVLLVAAGLFMRALDSRATNRPGVRRVGGGHGLARARGLGLQPGEGARVLSRLRARLEALPGVTAISYTGRLPLIAGSSMEDIKVDGTADVLDPSTAGRRELFLRPATPDPQGRAFRHDRR